MSTNEQLFLHQINNIASDGSVIVDVPYTPRQCSTTGTRGTAENSVPADVIVIDADNEDVIVNFSIPRDYHEGDDYLRVELLVAYVSGTSIDLQADAVSRGRAGTAWADEDDFTAATADTVDSDFNVGTVTATLDDLDWVSGDVLAVNFVASGRVSSGVAHVLGAKITYKSTLVAYSDGNR